MSFRHLCSPWILAAFWGAASPPAAAQVFGALSPPPPTPEAVVSGNGMAWGFSPSNTPSMRAYYANRVHGFVESSVTFTPFPNSPKFLSSGGGSSLQDDESWAYWDANGPNRFDPASGYWFANGGFGPSAFIQNILVGPGYGDDCHPYEVWMELVDPINPYLMRFDYCAQYGFHAVVQTSFGLSRLALGGGEVWALDRTDHVFRFNGDTGQFEPMPGTLNQLAVGVDGVWGLDAAGQAYEFNPASQSWDALTASAPLDAIWAGGDGVFARKCLPPVLEPGLSRALAQVRPPLACRHQLVRYEPVTRRFVDITAANQPPSLSVGSGAGANGVLPGLQVIQHWEE